jgi:integrase
MSWCSRRNPGLRSARDNIGPRYMELALEHAGLRKFRFHDLRHTFGSLLIQAGISPAYVQKADGPPQHSGDN